MDKRYSIKAAACGAIMASALMLCPALTYAGNVRQYTFAKGTKTYTKLTDATAIPVSNWLTQSVVFPGEDGTKVLPHKAQGFPIGFSFRYAGRDFDQFVISNAGWILLGKGEVDFKGYAGSAFNTSQVSELQGFYLGINPITYGTSASTPARGGSISYKTEGEEGKRVCTVQFDKLILDDESPLQEKGIYSVQVRMYEEDGKIEYAFKEDLTTYCSGTGFYAGLHGWDGTDALLLTSRGLGKATTVSEKRDGSLLDPTTYINWDENDADMEYKPVYTFTPTEEKAAPEAAPTALTLQQSGKSVKISCQRAEGSEATMILVSDRPFTTADNPVYGVTYPADPSMTLDAAKVGNARVVYYDDADAPTVTLNSISDSSTLYVMAVSVNGYPAYGINNAAKAELITAQAAPEWVNAAVKGNEVQLTWKSDFPVIVATTTEHPEKTRVYKGKFGQPTSTAAAGDDIADGGKVIYAGSEGGCSFTIDTPNVPVYFRVWTVNGTTVSATGADAAVVADATYPFIPQVENWPLYTVPLTWATNSKDVGFFPAIRDYAGDIAVRGWSSNGSVTTLTTPALPQGSEGVLKFEFAAETVRDAEQDPETGLMMLKGSEAGYFSDTKETPLSDDQGLFVEIQHADGTTVQKGRIEKYDGTMVVFNNTDYNDDSSSFQEETVELGNIAKDSKVVIKVCTGKTTKFFLRNISIEATPGNTAVESIALPTALKGIYSITGVKINADNVDTLPAGLYIVDGKKVVK